MAFFQKGFKPVHVSFFGTILSCGRQLFLHVMIHAWAAFIPFGIECDCLFNRTSVPQPMTSPSVSVSLLHSDDRFRLLVDAVSDYALA
jgi:hypothetical protein